MSAEPKISSLKYGTKAKTLKAYLIGLGLSLIFTCIAFAIVGEHRIDAPMLYILVTVLALAQLFTQVICFLRLNVTAEGRWNTMPFIFTLLIVAVVVGGSLWIMYNLNINMM